MTEKPTSITSYDQTASGLTPSINEYSRQQLDPHERTRRGLAARSINSLPKENDRLASYESGWGFFNEHAITPDGFHITQDDDLLLDVLLGEKIKEPLKQEPLSPEKCLVAQDGIRRLFSAAWGFNDGKPATLHEARQKLYELNQPERRATKIKLYKSGKFLQYQRPKPGTKYHEVYEDNGWYGDFLHFGVNAMPDNTPENDKLDHLMRVYVHAQPEYAGHIAAEMIRRMRSRYGKEIYGKALDISTADSPNTIQREDNLLFYLHTHSEMIAAAKIIKELTNERPQAFNAGAGTLDRARATDIAFTSIAEEPIQRNDVIQESFNSSRENIESEAQCMFVQEFLRIYPQIKGVSFREILQEAYTTGLKSKQELKGMYHQTIQFIAPKHGVSRSNYALNQRTLLKANSSGV